MTHSTDYLADILDTTDQIEITTVRGDGSPRNPTTRTIIDSKTTRSNERNSS